MIKEANEANLKKYRAIFPIYLTVQITILVVTLLHLPSTMALYQELGYKPVDGWLGLWFVLLLAGFSAGVSLWIFIPFRYMPFISRLNLIFGFFAGAWVGLVSLCFEYALDPSFSYFTAGCGVIWLIAFTLLRKNYHSQEIFP